MPMINNEEWINDRNANLTIEIFILSNAGQEVKGNRSTGQESHELNRTEGTGENEQVMRETGGRCHEKWEIIYGQRMGNKEQI